MKDQNNKASNGSDNRMITAIGNGIIRIQVRWAQFMDQKFNRYTARRQKHLLLAFILLVSGLCIYLVAESLMDKAPAVIKPVIVKVRLQENNKQDQPTGLEGIREILQQTDSLKSNDPLRWDSLCRLRPGLADSIRQLRSMLE